MAASINAQILIRCQRHEVMLLEFEMSGRETGKTLGRFDGPYFDDGGLFRSLGRKGQKGRRFRKPRVNDKSSSKKRSSGFAWETI